MRISDWSSDVCSSDLDYSAIYSAATQNGAPSTIMVNPDDFTTTGEISVDGEFDFITLDVVAGETYLVNVRGSGADPLEDTVLVLFDEADEFVGQDDDGGQATNSMFTFTARSEEHTSELPSLMRISYAVFCLKK